MIDNEFLKGLGTYVGVLLGIYVAYRLQRRLKRWERREDGWEGDDLDEGRAPDKSWYPERLVSSRCPTDLQSLVRQLKDEEERPFASLCFWVEGQGVAITMPLKILLIVSGDIEVLNLLGSIE
ncbi:uncharacterized protein BP01DRAFT_386184 [Aspergillus saccharolyticus JOP 1030-1]|uniref:Uncharacterized protein n=1 Tax=Aspergillus saccharolyticus JOP 1030-1 TaxID=1450539 RepID=A0A318Z3L1_9EURO|nr:hypothetical protein BP01DRAFT_386184 [Aspergillus saccharolyticus JOP 1030-1]PYH41656.1 hypothetical protein BP01DRAFT_386184 [Aspergillus saccharolyticus JOP 1030-1]